MTIKAGRVILPEPSKLERSSRGLSLAGHLNRTAAHAVTRAQLDGLVESANPPYQDEPIVPVTWSADASVDGFYRVLNGGWNVVRAGDYGDAFDWSLELERIAGNPLVASGLVGAVRSNPVLGIDDTDAPGWHVVPSARIGYDYGSPVDSATLLDSETGNVDLYTVDGEYTADVEWSVPPGNYYDGAAQILDANAKLIIGRAAVPRQIDNGLLRVDVTDASTPPAIRVSVFDGAAWDSWITFTIKDPAAVDSAAFRLKAATGRVLRNTPEMVKVAFDLVDENILFGARVAKVILLLRRGSRMVEVTVEGFGNLLVEVPAGTGSVTALVGGMQRSSQDADGNRWLMSSPDAAYTTASSAHLVAFTAAEPHSVALGVVLGGSGATGQNTAQAQVYRYHAAQYERQRVVQP